MMWPRFVIRLGWGKTFRNASRSLNHKATEICQNIYGNIPIKGTNTLQGIAALKDHYTQDIGIEGQMARGKTVAAPQVSGVGAWSIHNALKRDFEKYKKASQAPAGSDPASSKEAGLAAARKEALDPIRNV